MTVQIPLPKHIDTMTADELSDLFAIIKQNFPYVTIFINPKNEA